MKTKITGCKRTTVLISASCLYIMLVWTEIAETEELRHFLFQGTWDLSSC